MKTSKEKNVQKLISGGMILVSLAVGGVCGILLSRNSATEDGGIAVLFWQIILLALAVFLQIILHEAGHLVFGLLTGYRFLSFRVGSFTLQKDADGKMRIKRFSLAGTAGQCLMDPPDMQDGKLPYVLYNLGGILVNVLTAAVFIPLSLCTHGLLSFFFIALGAMGVLFALTNGLPLRMNGMPNDGYNALSLGKDREAMRALWLQLRVNALQTRGTRLRDMPDEWFEMPDAESMHSPLLSAVGVFAENRMLDSERFDDARQTIALLLSIDNLIPIYRSLLTLDKVYLDVLTRGEEADVSVLTDKKMQSFCRAMRRNPTVLRTRYTVALLHDKDAVKAQTVRTQFDKIMQRYPIAADIECERMLLDDAQNKIDTTI